MSFNDLSNSDVLRFGSVVATLRTLEDEEVIESSQAESQQLPRTFAKAFQSQSNFVIPETEVYCDSTTKNISDEMTQEMDIPETQEYIESDASDTLKSKEALAVDVISERDETSNHAVASQNLFAAISFIKDEIIDDDFDDIEMPTEQRQLLKDKAFDAREGSVTPDFDLSRSRSISPALISIVKPEPYTQPRIRQCDIETQLNPEVQIKEEVESHNSECLEETQIMEYESSDEKENKNVVLMQETQPMFINLKTRNQLKRQSELKPTTISLTDFEATEAMISPPKKRKCFSLDTQPVLPFIPQQALASEKVLNRILMSDDESDDDILLQKYAAGSENIRNIIAGLESPTKTPLVKINSQTPTTTQLSDYDTPEILPRSPRPSQFEEILNIVNVTEAYNDENAVDFDTMNSDDSKLLCDTSLKPLNHPEKSGQPLKRTTRRKLMKYASDSEEDQPSKVVEKGEDIAKPQEQTKLYSIAISSYEEANEKYEQLFKDLGAKIVSRIAEADFLLTKDDFESTSKVLASICKGIPIVGDEFMDESFKAGKWLNPQDFIIRDSKLEQAKKINLKDQIQKASQQKLFQECSVFATKNTKIPFDRLKEIIENAGGECLKISQKPSFKNLYLCYNANEEGEVKKMQKKYKKVQLLLDTSMSRKFLNQKL